MPMQSKAQNRFMRWAHEHPGESGVPEKVSGEFIASAHGKSLEGLPDHVQHKAQGGAVRGYPRKFRW